MNFDCGIYTITSPSGKQYIGQAMSFKRRWRTHLRLLRRGCHTCKGLQNAYKKYGEDALVFSKIAFVPVDQLDAREQEQIDARPRKRLYNIALFATAPMRGRKVSAETRSKMSASRLGKTMGAEFRARCAAAQRNLPPDVMARKSSAISLSKLGKPRDAATIEKMRQAKIGAVVRADVRARISASLTGIERSAEYREKMALAIAGKSLGEKNSASIPVICVETGERFANAPAAAKWLRENGKPNATAAHICSTCTGKRGSAYGYRWKYPDVPQFTARGLIKVMEVAV
jgi:group I intron endonuclease